MKFNLLTASIACMLLVITAMVSTAAEGQFDRPKDVPSSRSEMKQQLEVLKRRQPRLAVPLEDSSGGAAATVNNARARRFFLPAEWFAGEQRSLGGQNSEELVDYELKTKCFWVVSRGNNCHYCLGHQEHKLHMIGLSDDQVAALDHDWDSLDSRTRKAVELARKMTLQPHEMNEADVVKLRPDFTDEQIIELVHTIARFNATNRWTDAMGLPQDSEMRGESISFLTPTAATWSKRESLAAPEVDIERPLPTQEAVQSGLEQASRRTAYVKLPAIEATQEKLAIDRQTPLTDWHRSIAALVSGNPASVANFEAMMKHDELSPSLKAQILYRTALNNRSWATLASAKRRLDAAGIAPLLDNGQLILSGSDAEVAALRLADKLTVSPFTISDKDIIELREHFTDRQIAQIVHVTATGNSLDRLSETLGLSAAIYSDPTQER